MHLAKYIEFGVATAILTAMCGRLPADAPTTAPATAPAIVVGQKPGEIGPSDDATVKDFHNLGEIGGTGALYRSADPVRDVEKKTGKPLNDPATLAQIDAIFQHLHERGIRTIVCLEKPTAKAGSEKGETQARFDLEKSCAEKAGITFIAHPMTNSGKDSLEDMTDEQTLAWLESVEGDLFKAAKNGGVEFHCAGGHDRTGIVTAFLRMKYLHWTAEEAIQEMRNMGHNWTKFSKDGGKTSWHENHLRGIAGMLGAATAPATAP